LYDDKAAIHVGYRCDGMAHIGIIGACNHNIM
jgi:hypothetical protein